MPAILFYSVHCFRKLCFAEPLAQAPLWKFFKYTKKFRVYLICWFITIDKVLVDNFLRPPRSHFYFWPPEIWRPALPPLLFLISFFSSWMRAHKTIVIKMWWFPQHFLGIIPPTTNDKGCNGNRNIWRFQAPCVTFGSPLKAASRSCTLVGWKKIWDNFDLFSKIYKEVMIVSILQEIFHRGTKITYLDRKLFRDMYE